MPEPATAIPVRMTDRSGILQMATPAEVQTIEKVEQAKRDAEKDQQKPEMLSLAAHLSRLWESAKQGKIEIDTRLLKCLRQRKGEYDPDMKVKIAAHGGSDIYMYLTSMKCRAAEAWIKDIVIPPGEKPWSLDPTPEPDLPGDILDKVEELVQFEAAQLMAEQGIESVTVEQVRDRIQELKDQIFKEHMETAKASTHRIERRIEDQLREGNFYFALDKFINDLVTFPAAFISGPLIRKKKGLVWDKDDNGEAFPKVDATLKREYKRVSPFDIYPSRGAKSVQDGSLFERLRLRRSDFAELKNVSGYNSAAIDGMLLDYGAGGLREWLWTDQERAEAENKPQGMLDPEPIIDALLFWGQIQGKMLREWGMSDKQVPNITQDYQVCAMVIGRWVIMARLNPHPLGLRPYFSAAYEEIADSIWGKSIPELMRDIQVLCNAAARSLVNNMAIASGPQVEVHFDRLEPGEDVENLYPWKITKTKSDERGGTDSKAMHFYQPSDNSEKLIGVYKYWFDQASEVTGIPSYFQGSQHMASGAGKTASGLSMLMNAATKTLKGVIFHVDGVIKPIIKEHWMHIMLYDTDIEKTGDINVVARASEYLIMQEQLQLRLVEYLNFTNNPVDMQIMGLKGRAAIHRELSKFLKIPGEDIIPPKEAFEEQEQQQGMMGQPLIEGGQVSGQRGTEILPAGQKAGGQEARVVG